VSPRSALVTGVVGGIGAAIASRLADDGASMVVCDLPGDRLTETAAALDLPTLAADLTEPTAVSDLVASIARDHGAPEILVNAAGGVCG